MWGKAQFLIFALAKAVYPASMPVSDINDHFDLIFNDEEPNLVVFTQPGT